MVVEADPSSAGIKGCSSPYQIACSETGVFRKLWKKCLTRYDELKGIDWSFCSMDGAMSKAPLAGEKKRPQSYVTEPQNAHVKDKLENVLHELVCSGKLPLEEVQKAIATN
jgi:hypothetical protein